MTTKFAFAYNDASLITKVSARYSEYCHFYVSAAQYGVIEPLIAGCEMAGSRKDAFKFLLNRDDALFQEASANDGVLPYGCCSSYADHDLLMYETTSGTVMTRDLYDDHIISLHISRKGGFHHKIILLVLAGVTAAQLSRYENLHTIDANEFESAHKERKALYDSILCQHGYKPHESWEQHVQAECERKASLASRVGEWSIDDTDYEDYEDYEGADLQDDDS